MSCLYDQIALSLSKQNRILACVYVPTRFGETVPINEARQNSPKTEDCFAPGKAVHLTDTRQRIRLTRQIMIKVLEPPPLSGLIRETRGLLELPRLMLRFRDLARQPRGQGQPVLLLPGYGAGDGSTAILKSYLRLLGYGSGAGG